MRTIPLIAVTVLACSAATADDTPAFDCLIEPHRVVEVNSAVQGKIGSIEVERSDPVQQGQVLVELDSAVEKATVELARARAQMDAELRTRQVSQAFANRKLVRFDDLYKEDVVSLQKQDEVKTEAVLAGLQLEQARENLTVAELELKRAEAVLEQRTVTSPITGVVVERYKSAGEFVEDEPILRLAQLDPLNVEVILPADLFGTIKTGMQASVVPETPGDTGYPAQVAIVDRVVDASSGTFGVRLELANPDYRIPGGLKCLVSFLPDTDTRRSDNTPPASEPSQALAASH